MRDRVVFVGHDDDAAMAEAVLSPEMEVLHLSADAACAVVERRDAALLVFGFGEPWRAQWAGLARLQAVALQHPLRVLALVPRDDVAGLELAFAHGVADCAGWPIDPIELGARVRMLLERRRAAEARRAEAQAIRRDAETDALTGLGNRRLLEARLAAAIARARAKDLPLALLMLDVDGLKPINDRLGHPVGDVVLRRVGEALDAHVRAGDLVARYGGDELAVLMPDADLATAQAVAARLCMVVAELEFAAAVRTTISIGVAALADSHADGPALVAQADAALYAAKREGRNRVSTDGGRVATI